MLAHGSRHRGEKFGLSAVSALALSVFATGGALAQCAGGAATAPFSAFASGGPANTLLSAINATSTDFLTESTASIGTSANPRPGQSGGVWARGIGGEQTTRGTTTSSGFSASHIGVPGSVTCQSKTDLHFAGVEVGTDMATFNYKGWTLHLGSSLGYLGATGKDVTSPGSANPFGGTFSDSLEIPFGGVYASVTRGGFFLNGAARELYFQNTASDWQAGLLGQGFDARSFAINGSAGYDFELPNAIFIEPSAGFLWSTTEVDPINQSGSGSTLPGTVHISQIYNAIGHVTLKVGTTFDAGNMILQPFGSASFFREFKGDPSVSFDTYSALGVPVSGRMSTTGIGNYGQFGLGLSGEIKNTGWLGFIRADYLTGDNIQGWTLNGGMRYQFSSEIVRHPFITKGPQPAAESYNWTGLRVGAALGEDWGYSNWSFADGTGTSPRFAGILPTGMVGYDYQIGKWVAGVGADMGWTHARGAAACPNGPFTCENRADWIATATGRLGYAFWGDRVLSYVKAGLAVADFTAKTSCDTASQPAGCPGSSMSKTAAGWTIGAGTEFALNNNWSVRAETNYFDLGKDQYSLNDGAGIESVNIRHKGYTALIGLTYRFDIATPAPIIAKY